MASDELPKRGDILAYKYHVVRPIDDGGMGIVFEAFDPVLGRSVAVKWVRRRGPNDDSRERVFREARLAATVRHPNVVQIHEVVLCDDGLGDEDAPVILVMEFLPGVTLAQQLAHGDGCLHQLIGYLLGAMRGIAAVHRCGIVHRDIKPANIQLTRYLGERHLIPKVLDFGISKRIDGGGRGHDVTAEGKVMRTLRYASPEHLKGHSPDPRMDVWSLAVVLYELATGRMPFNGETDAQLMSQIFEADPAPLRQLNPNLPEGLEAIVAAALHRDPEHRTQSVELLIAQVEPYAHDASCPKCQARPRAVQGRTLHDTAPNQCRAVVPSGGAALEQPATTEVSDSAARPVATSGLSGSRDAATDQTSVPEAALDAARHRVALRSAREIKPVGALDSVPISRSEVTAPSQPASLRDVAPPPELSPVVATRRLALLVGAAWLLGMTTLLGGLWCLADAQEPGRSQLEASPPTLSAAGLLEPREDNVLFRAPRITQGLRGLTVHRDGARAWAVGDRGTIVRTTDLGVHWWLAPSGTQANLVDVFFLADGVHGWAAGSDGTIVASLDGGQTWQRQVTGTTASLTALTFLPDGLHGWAVSRQGTILRTVDGGIVWTRSAELKTAGSSTPLSKARADMLSFSSVSFLDARHGWAVGARGLMAETRDGGKTWQVHRRESLRGQLHEVVFPHGGARGWAVGDGGVLLTTTNGGASWQTQNVGIPAALTSIGFAQDGQRGWLAGTLDGAGVVLTTRDGGGRWTQQTSALGARAWSRTVLFDDAQHGLAVGDGGRIDLTTDRGRTWLAQAGKRDWPLRAAIASPDGERIWALAGDLIVASDDAGHTWTPQYAATDGTLLRGIGMLPDGLHGWAVGEHGMILRTRDGRSWQRIGASALAPIGLEGETLRAVAVVDASRAWVVGAAGSIAATSDGGATWRRQHSGTTALLHGVAFAADGELGVVVGSDGTLLVTTDGVQWVSRPSGSTGSLNAVAVAPDGMSAWAVGDGGVLIASRDAGRSWTPQPSGTRVRLSSVRMLGRRKGWATGERGTVIATVDGSHWVTQQSGTKEWLEAVVTSSDGSRGLIVGRGPTILATGDGGGQWRQEGAHRTSVALWFHAAALIVLSMLWLGLLRLADSLRRPPGSPPRPLRVAPPTDAPESLAA